MNTSTRKGSDIMSKKTIIAGIMSIMMLGAVPAFAATPQNSELIPSQHISAHTDHHRHHREEIRPHKHREYKNHHRHNHYRDDYHKHHNSDTIDETTRGRGN